jgi:glycolate oxidase
VSFKWRLKIQLSCLGGTITGENGIGIAKKSFLPKFAGDAQMRVMHELRRALDPNGILTPGKMF